MRSFGNENIISNWLRNRNSLEFIGIWEELNNPNLNSLEFEGFKNQAGQVNSEYLRRKGLKLLEQLFNYGEFATIKSMAGLHSYGNSTRDGSKKQIQSG